MSTITKERAQEIFLGNGPEPTASEERELARIALASLEAEPAIHRWRRVTSEPYGPYPWHYGDFIGFSKPVEGIEDEYYYSAPPEPANAEPVSWLWSHRKHPSEVSIVRPEDDERAEGAHWSGWSCQALYAAPPAPVSVPDEDLLHMAASAIDDLLSNKDRSGAGVWADIPAKLRRAAMLQGVEPVTTAYKSPDDFICMLTGRAKYLREKGEIKSPELLERAAAALQCGSVNTTPIPNGWKLVPIDPTKDMLRAGQSVVGFWLNTVHCYSKMLAAAPAAPQQEVKP